jgi:mono/diheme cytochrome c family protein
MTEPPIPKKRRFLFAVALVSLLAVATVLFFSDDIPTVSAVQVVSDDSLIERGEYLALAGNCASCHTADGGDFMAGGLAFETPFGTIYSTNITPDKDTGIGDWTADEFLSSMRHGVRPDGEHLYPVFPYTAFTKVTNEDVAAIFAYLKSVPAVVQKAPDNNISFPFNQRSLMKVWKALFFNSGAFIADESQSDEWNRGAYLVEALAHCSACHSPRNVLGAEKAGRLMAGGEYTDKVPGGMYKPWYAPNLTQASTGLSLWSTEDVTDYLKTGRNSFLESFGPMNEVIMNSTRHLSDADVGAMAEYLKDIPAHERTDGPTASDQVMGRGRTIYNLHCGTCHLPTGLGDPEMAPRINEGSLVVQAENPASMINVILYGPELPDLPLPRWRNPMEEFQYLLDDDEVAAVASYIRNSWDNSVGQVTSDQVARQR